MSSRTSILTINIKIHTHNSLVIVRVGLTIIDESIKVLFAAREMKSCSQTVAVEVEATKISPSFNASSQRLYRR
jgi:hypothetical protein